MTEITRLRARAQMLSRLAKAAPGALAGRLSSRAEECLQMAVKRERDLAQRPQDGRRAQPARQAKTRAEKEG
jgi:hypothetical protein